MKPNFEFVPKGSRLAGIFLSVVFSLFFVSGNAQNKKLYLEKPLEGVNLNSAEVFTSGGSIELIHKAGEKIRVEVYVQGNNSKSLSDGEIASRMKNYELTVAANGGKLTASAKSNLKNGDWKNGLSISFKIYTGSNISGDLKTSGGSISISQLTGNQRLQTSGGSLNIEGITGNIEGKTSGGSISIQQVKGAVDVMTSGGSIKASTLSGKIRLTTSGGSLSLTDLQGEIEAYTSGGSVSGSNIGGSLDTKTSGGGISLKDMHCSLNAATSAGSINVEMKSLGKFITLRNSAGRINLKLPEGSGLNLDLQGDNISIPGLSNFNGTNTSRSVKGTVSGGGIPVSVKSSGGGITIKF